MLQIRKYKRGKPTGQDSCSALNYYEYNHCLAGPCGKGNVTEWANWLTSVVQVQSPLQPMLGGPCGMGSSTEGAGSLLFQ